MKSLLTLSLLFLISCGQSNQQNQVLNKEIESASSQNLAVLTNQGDAFDYGSMLNTASSITKVYKYKNTGDVKSSEAPVASISGDSAYSLVLQSGCSALLNVGSTCQVRVMFNPSGKAPGTYKTILKLGASPLLQQELIAVVTAPLAPTDPGYVAPPVSYTINTYNEVPAIISAVDMGSFSGTQSLTKIVTFKNEGTGSAPLDSAVVSNSTDFSILNQCVSKTLAPNSSCQVRFTFSASGKVAGQAYSSNVTFLGKSIPVSAAMLSVAQAPVLANIISLDGASEVSSIDLGTLQQTDSITKIITFKNNGTGASVVGNSTESDSSNFSYIDQCQNKALAVNGSCTVRATISAKNKSGPFSTVISFLGKSVTITGSISVADVISYSPTYSSYGSCNAQACDGQGVQSRTIVKCNKVTNGVAGIAVDNSFCSSFAISANLDKSCASPAGDKTIALSNGSKVVSCLAGSASQSFKSISCNPEFHANGELCVGDVITYSANYSSYGSCNAQACDGQGTQSRTLVSCNKLRNGAQDSIVDNSFCSALNSQAYLDQPCSSPAGDKTIALSNGSKVVSCLVGSSSQSFKSISCDNGYYGDNQLCAQKYSIKINKELSYSNGISAAEVLNSTGYNVGVTIGGSSYSPDAITNVSTSTGTDFEFFVSTFHGVGTSYDRTAIPGDRIVVNTTIPTSAKYYVHHFAIFDDRSVILNNFGINALQGSNPFDGGPQVYYGNQGSDIQINSASATSLDITINKDQISDVGFPRNFIIAPVIFRKVCNLSNSTNSGFGLSSITGVSSVSGYAGACLVNTCLSNYQVSGDSKSCQPISCTVANSNILNAASVTGDLVNGCSVATCNSNYEISGNSCQPISCTVANANKLNATAVSGTLVSGCLATSCSSGFKVQNGSCVTSSYVVSFEDRNPNYQQGLCAILNNGGVSCFGSSDQYGEMGNFGGVSSYNQNGISANMMNSMDGSSSDKKAQKIVNGNIYRLVLSQNGSVRGYGYNGYGNLGNGTTNNSKNSGVVNYVNGIDGSGDLSTQAQDIAIANLTACAIMKNSSIKCWGRLIGTTGGSSSAVAVQQNNPVNITSLDSNLTNIYGFNYVMCSLNNIGAVQCWGSFNSGYQSNFIGYTSSYNSINQAYRLGSFDGVTSKAKSILVGYNGGAICVIDINDALTCYGIGLNTDGLTNATKVASIKEVTAGFYILKMKDNKIKFWTNGGSTFYNNIIGDSSLNPGAFNSGFTFYNLYPNLIATLVDADYPSQMFSPSFAFDTNGKLYASGGDIGSMFGHADTYVTSQMNYVYRFHFQTASITETPLGNDAYQWTHTTYPGVQVTVYNKPVMLSQFDGTTLDKQVKSITTQWSGSGICAITNANNMYCWGTTASSNFPSLSTPTLIPTP